jgi:hypothetical protein
MREIYFPILAIGFLIEVHEADVGNGIVFSAFKLYSLRSDAI